MLLAIEVLKEIKEVEVTAENLKKQASVKARDIVKAATDQAHKELDHAEQEAQSITSRIVNEKEDEARKKANSIMESSEADCKAIRAVSEQKISKAVNLVIERIVKAHGNS